jgi:hypothetical protein
MRTRPDSRRDYRHFPREYTDILVRFEQTGRVVLTFNEAREAHAARRELYRFKTFVSAGVDDNSDDTHARWLLDVFNTVTMRLEQVDGQHALVLDSNPLVRAMRASAVRPPEGSAVAAPEAQAGEVAGEAHSAPPPHSVHIDALSFRACPTPFACRSAFGNSPAFCECGDTAEPQKETLE